MKLSTSLKNASRIASKVKGLNGIICTPTTTNKAVKIKRMWLFGSTVKGKENPNDTDILIEYVVTPETTQRGGHGDNQLLGFGKYKLWSVAASKSCWFNRYYNMGKSAEVECLKFLRGGMKKVRFHIWERDGQVGDIPETKVMIYPINKLEA